MVGPIIEVVKLILASVASVVFLGFACLTLAGSAVGVAISTPIFIIFSPVLVPATVAVAVLTTGFAAGTGFLSTGLGLFIWLIKKKLGVKPKNNPPPKGGPGGKDATSPTEELGLMDTIQRIKRIKGIIDKIKGIFGMGASYSASGDESAGKSGKHPHRLLTLMQAPAKPKAAPAGKHGDKKGKPGVAGGSSGDETSTSSDGGKPKHGKKKDHGKKCKSKDKKKKHGGKPAKKDGKKDKAKSPATPGSSSGTPGSPSGTEGSTPGSGSGSATPASGSDSGSGSSSM